MSSEKWRQAVLRGLGQNAGDDADPRLIVAAAVDALGSLLSELEPLIGDRGAWALYRRSVQLAKARFPWLAARDAPESASTLAVDLRTRLDARDAKEACAASIALLTALTDLLATLIGEPLTHRILLAAWRMNGSDERTPGSKP